ncbi:MAG: hypothetical protein UY35_C0033G0006 [Candidatus Saccharibacteria bacterium GW2011_GWC2_48_9]|nr:MAG: hypothetical protein UY35_C0033G0006 [Candidatus Saccharibacteria bacterium GW2011_GWC2_48_9]
MKFRLYTSEQHKYNSGMNTLQKQQAGISLPIVMVVILALTTIVFGGLAIWAYTEYQRSSTDVNSQVRIAVVEAQKEQQEDDEEKFAQREKEPNLDFTTPDDYGRVTFKYPKNWSVYVATDPTRGGKYEAYLHPKEVPMVKTNEQFALRVLIEDRDYDQVTDSYKSKVNSGDLAYSTTNSQGNIGARYDGNFSQNIRGAAVAYKVRDKTLTLRTDADTFKPDFEAIIKTISFNQ